MFQTEHLHVVSNCQRSKLRFHPGSRVLEFLIQPRLNVPCNRETISARSSRLKLSRENVFPHVYMLFQVVEYWSEKGRSGFIVRRYLLRRDDEVNKTKEFEIFLSEVC